jgi:MFS family permease
MYLTDRFIPANVPDYARRTLRLDFWSATALQMFAIGGPTTAAVIAKKWFDAPDYLIAMLYSAGPVGLIASAWVSTLIRRYGAVNYAFVYYVISALLMVFAAMMTTAWAFILALCVAYALPATVPALSRIYRQNYPTQMRGRLFSVVRVASNTSMALGGFIVGRVLNTDPGAYQWVYLTITAIGMTGALIFRKIEVRDEESVNKSTDSSQWAALRHIIKTDRRYIFMLGIWAIFGFTNFMLEPVRAIFITDPQYSINADYLQSLLILMVLPQISIVLSLPMWGRLLDRYSVVVLRVIMQSIGFANVLIFIFVPRIEWLYLAGVIRGVQMAGGLVTWHLAMMEFAPRDQVSEYTALHTLFTGIRGMIAPQVSAVLILLAGPMSAFWVGFVGIGLSVALFLMFPRITSGWPIPEGAPVPRRMSFTK